MNGKILETVFVVLIVGIAIVTLAAANNGKAVEELTVGVYDSRAIAIAWASSVHNDQITERMKQYEQAKQDGDARRMQELERWGESHQRKLHFQGFGEYPVYDLLEDVKGKLPQLAEAQGVDVIVARCDYVAEGVKTKDITIALVKLYDPTERTLKMAESIVGKKRVPFEQLIAMPASH